MRLFATALGLLTIVVNTTTAFSGTVLSCKHETGDSHFVSKMAHESKSHIESCHSPSSESNVGHAPGESCNSCTDTEIENKASLDKAHPSQDRSTAKSPSLCAYSIYGYDIIIAKPQEVAESFPARAPPFAVSAAALQFATTVQFRL